MTPAHKFACMNITFLHAWAGLLRSHGRPNMPSRHLKESSRMAGGVGWVGGWGGVGVGGGQARGLEDTLKSLLTILLSFE